jgi:hypothetical protein
MRPPPSPVVVLSMWPCNNISPHLSIVIFLFPNSTHQTENGTAYMWELLIANHLHQSFMFGQSKIGNSSQIKTTPFIKFYSPPNSRIVKSAVRDYMIITLDKSQICELCALWSSLPLCPEGFFLSTLLLETLGSSLIRVKWWQPKST